MPKWLPELFGPGALAGTKVSALFDALAGINGYEPMRANPPYGSVRRSASDPDAAARPAHELSSGLTTEQWMVALWLVRVVVFLLVLNEDLRILTGPDCWLKSALDLLDEVQLGGLFSPVAAAAVAGQLFKFLVRRPLV